MTPGSVTVFMRAWITRIPEIETLSLGRGPGTGLLVLFIMLVALGGCATTSGEPEGNRDPWEGFNRATYQFNDFLDRWALKPVARGYKKVTPQPVRRSVSNFFNNLNSPVVIVNNLLQAKFLTALSDTGRFITNSTIGLAGLLDPATRFGLEEHQEDFGQTLAVWGIADGPYLVLPLFGPSTIRGAVGTAAGTQISPLVQLDIPFSVRVGAFFLRIVDTRAQLLEADRVIQEAFDPYVFIREAYFQRRRYLIYDGNPPLEYPELDLEEPPQEAP